MTLFEAGFRNLQGVDPYVDGNIEYSGGWRVLRGTIGDCKGTWDVIMFHHSFEHVRDPVETLRAAVNLLADQGTIVVRIPVVSSYAWERYGVAWVQLDAPRHFFLHSRQSMTRLAETVGLRLARVAYDSTEFQFLGSEQYLRDIPLMAKGSSALSGGESIFSAEEVQAYCRLAKELNASERGDQAAFYLKKL